jgi:methyltransferase (TIGR00027 family)
MREDRPSWTATVVALGRALYERAPEAYGPTGDALTAELLPSGWRLLARAGAPLWSASPSLARQAFRAATFGLSEHVALRTRVIDEALADAVRARGCRQLVTLGAGLDTRPWRMDALADVSAFEVDHPATQRTKRARCEGWTARARSVSFVSVDFTRDSLAERLAQAGHDAAAPTAWVLEGVTVYLGRAALEATLDAIVERSAPGSVLAMTYVPRSVVSRWSQGQRSIDAVTRAIGERFEGLLEQDEAATLLRARGLRVERDEGTAEMAARHTPAVKPETVWERERVVIASR